MLTAPNRGATIAGMRRLLTAPELAPHRALIWGVVIVALSLVVIASPESWGLLGGEVGLVVGIVAAVIGIVRLRRSQSGTATPQRSAD